jgi:RNA polymerase sigma-54 factor
MGEEYVILLNDEGLPRLRLSSYYREILKKSNGAPEATREYIQDKLKSAVWLIKSIQQRQRTIYRVVESLIKFQKNFFENGVAHLRPLVLRDVAEDIGMHESTISRVTSNKYVHTPQGTFELKYFFNSAISQLGGDDLSSESIKNRLRQIIQAENSEKPLSDKAIAEIFEKDNIQLARRTVAKYREQLGILPSKYRKRPKF